jgi:glucokinase
VILAGDVGGTKILLEVGEVRSGRWAPAFARRYSAADVVQFEHVMHQFLDEFGREAGGDARKIRSGALGVAGPLEGNVIKMTNRPWAVDGDRIASRCGIERFRVMNDLAACARGIDAIDESERITIQPGEPDPRAPRVVVGVGTGLGVAYVIPHGERSIVVPGEGGHAGFAPETPEQFELWRTLFAALGRVEVEDVVSGRGLANVYDFMAKRETGGIGLQNATDPAWVSEKALAGTDAGCQAALDLFAECLGNVARWRVPCWRCGHEDRPRAEFAAVAPGVLREGGVHLAFDARTDPRRSHRKIARDRSRTSGERGVSWNCESRLPGCCRNRLAARSDKGGR